MIQWFGKQEFKDTAFVHIRDSDAFDQLAESQHPPGTEMTPCALPRLALGLTPQGSLIGLFGVSIQT